MPPAADTLVQVARIGRTHGVRGELLVRPENPDSQLFVTGLRLVARDLRRSNDGSGTDRELTVSRARPTPKGWLVVFEGVSERDTAARLTNQHLFVRRTDLPTPEPDAVYLTDIVGCLVHTPAGTALGRVLGFFANGAHEVCVVQTDAGDEVLLPFRDENLVDVDLQAQVVVLDVPDGIPGLESLQP